MATKTTSPASSCPRMLRIVSPTVRFSADRVCVGVQVTMPTGEVATYHVARNGNKVTFTKTSKSARKSPSGDDGEPRVVDLDFGVCSCPGHQRWRTECRHLGMVRVLKGRELI